MAKLNNIADAVKYVIKFIRFNPPNCHYSLREYVNSFITTYKCYCYDNGISLSDPNEEFDPTEDLNELIKAQKMINEHIQKEAFILCSRDEKCIRGWRLISDEIDGYLYNHRA